MSKTELLQQTIERFWDTVPEVWGQVRSNLRSNATSGFQITLVQFHILRHIRRGVNTTGELAEKILISRPAVSQAVDLLVQRGLVKRSENPMDRRFVSLELTQTGEKLMNTVYAESRQWMSEKMASLTTDEMNTLLQAFTLLNGTFNIT